MGKSVDNTTQIPVTVSYPILDGPDEQQFPTQTPKCTNHAYQCKVCNEEIFWIYLECSKHETKCGQHFLGSLHLVFNKAFSHSARCNNVLIFQNSACTSKLQLVRTPCSNANNWSQRIISSKVNNSWTHMSSLLILPLAAVLLSSWTIKIQLVHP